MVQLRSGVHSCDPGVEISSIPQSRHCVAPGVGFFWNQSQGLQELWSLLGINPEAHGLQWSGDTCDMHRINDVCAQA